MISGLGIENEVLHHSKLLAVLGSCGTMTRRQELLGKEPGSRTSCIDAKKSVYKGIQQGVYLFHHLRLAAIVCCSVQCLPPPKHPSLTPWKITLEATTLFRKQGTRNNGGALNWPANVMIEQYVEAYVLETKLLEFPGKDHQVDPTITSLSKSN